MKLKYKFEMLELGEEIVAVPAGKDALEYHGVIKLNDSASLIFQMLMCDISENEIVASLENEYDISRDLLVEYVHDFIMRLDDNGVLVR